MDLTHKDVKSIIGIIDDAQHLDDIELVFAGFRLHVKRSSGSDTGGRAPPSASFESPLPAASPKLAQATQPAARARVEQPAAEGEIVIRAPMLGTFYRAPSPGKNPFVEVGQRVTPDDSVGVIEVMKLFNSIRAGVHGTIVRINVENAALVEFNEALIVIAAD